MALEDLYGAGARDQLVAALNAVRSNVALADQLEDAKGAVYCNATWQGGGNPLVTFVCMPDRWHFTGIDGNAAFYRGLRDQLPPLAKGWGVVTFTAAARDLTAKQQLQADSIGVEFVERSPGELVLVWTL